MLLFLLEAVFFRVTLNIFLSGNVGLLIISEVTIELQTDVFPLVANLRFKNLSLPLLSLYSFIILS